MQPEPQLIFPFGFDTISTRLHPLPDGRLIIRDSGHWKIYNADGSQNPALLPEFQNHPFPPIPQFITSDRLYLISQNSPRTLQVYRTTDLQPDPTFNPPDFDNPPFAACQGPEGKIWLVLASLNLGSPSQRIYRNQTLIRLLPNGSLDDSFDPVSLHPESDYQIHPAHDGGFTLVRYWINRQFFWPSPSHNSLETITYNASGEVIATDHFSIPLTFPITRFAIEKSGNAIHPDQENNFLIRNDGNPAFSIPLPGPGIAENLPMAIRSFSTYPGDRYLIGGVRRHLSDGSPDPAWHIARPEKSGAVNHLLHTDTGIIATGTFDRADGHIVRGLIQLNFDGSYHSTPSTDFDWRWAGRFQPLPDGSYLAKLTKGVPDPDDGLTSFHVAKVGSSFNFDGYWDDQHPDSRNHVGTNTAFVVRPDGNVLTRSVTLSEVASVSTALYTPEGEKIEDFGTYGQLPLSSSGNVHSHPPFVLSDNRIIWQETLFDANGMEVSDLPEALEHATPILENVDGDILFQKYESLHETTMLWWDGTNVRPAVSVPEYLIGQHATPAPNDKLFTQAYRPTDSLLFYDKSTPIRHHSTGQIDHSFKAPVIDHLSDMLVVGNHLWLAGGFHEIEGTTKSGLAMLDISSVAGFENWIAAAAPNTTGLSPEDDPDHDGCSNFEEYAAGTDPLNPRSNGHPQLVEGTTWQVPCNPEAPEIIRRLQFSTDLLHWQTALGNQVRIETTAPCYTWTILPGQAPAFTRLRYGE